MCEVWTSSSDEKTYFYSFTQKDRWWIVQRLYITHTFKIEQQIKAYKDKQKTNKELKRENLKKKSNASRRFSRLSLSTNSCVSLF